MSELEVSGHSKASLPPGGAPSRRTPGILIHGEEDENVPIRQSELMDEALRNAGREVRFVRVPDSGHHWSKWSAEHRLTLLTETSTFLEQHLE